MRKEPKPLPKRQRWVVGAIHEIDLLEGIYGYVQTLEIPQAAFYHLFRKEGDVRPSIEDIVNSPVAFKISIYGGAIIYRWPRLGKVPLDEKLNEYKDKFRYDDMKKKYFIIGNGHPPNGTLALKEDIQDLECYAIWPAPSIEQRLRDLHAGRLNWHVENFKSRPAKKIYIKDFYAKQGYDFHWMDDELEDDK